MGTTVYASCPQFIDSLSQFENVFLGKVLRSELVEFPPFGFHYSHADTSQHKYMVKYIEHKIKIYSTYKGPNYDTATVYEEWQGGQNTLIIGFVYLVRCYSANHTKNYNAFLPKRLDSKLMTNACMNNKYLAFDWFSEKAIKLDYNKLEELLKLDEAGQFKTLFGNEKIENRTN
jgi:hypothetical protein